MLEGRGSNDLLQGGTGSDTLYGGACRHARRWGRNDTLSGGVGNDVFLFATGGGKDIITDFALGDLVEISGYTSAQSIVQVGTDVVVTLSSTDKVTLQNATLSTVKAAFQFASGSGGSIGGATITGTNGDDTLNGIGLGDVILGLGGYDVINGGFGNDRIYGGSAATTSAGAPEQMCSSTRRRRTRRLTD